MNQKADFTKGAPLKLHFMQELPVVTQAELAECGLACLAMIAGYHGYEIDLSLLRRKHCLSIHGSTMDDLVEIAYDMNFVGRVFRVEPNQIESIQLPCVIHWEMNHFVVLSKRRGRGFVIHDPAVGKRYVDAKEFDGAFTGIALELVPSKNFQPRSEKVKPKISDLWSDLRGLKRTLLNLLVLSILLQLFALTSPFLMQLIVDDIVVRLDGDLLIIITLGFAILLTVQTVTSYLRDHLQLFASSQLGYQMSTNVFRHLMSLPSDFFSKRHMGDIISRFGSIGKIKNIITNSLIVTILDGSLVFITLFAMLFYDTRLTLAVGIFVAINVAYRLALLRPLLSANDESISATAKESSHFMESIRAAQTIKIYQNEVNRQSAWMQKMADSVNKNVKIEQFNILFRATNSFLYGVENLVVLYLASKLVMSQELSVGMLYAYVSYKERFKNSVNSLVNQWIEWKLVNLHLERLGDIVHSPVDTNFARKLSAPINLKKKNKLEQTDKFTHTDYRWVKGKIEVRNLSYKYSDRSPHVFEDLNFTIQPGSKVLISGNSGTGKTTLIKCLMGLKTPTSGIILIDDIPLVDFGEYRSQIASVMQEDTLLSGSIADNISSFSSDSDMNLICLSAKRASIHDEIMRMPMKYDTLINDMGVGLSGGQKQRIAWARAFYQLPKILFLDEAMSNLDRDNSKRLIMTLESLKITVISIAHNEEQVGNYDYVVELT